EPFTASCISSRVSSAACLPRSGFMPVPRPRVRVLPMWIFFFAFDLWRSCASVLTAMKSTPSTLEETMWLTALPPEPPTPMTRMRANDSTSDFTCFDILRPSYHFQEMSKLDKRANRAINIRGTGTENSHAKPHPRNGVDLFSAHHRRDYLRD